MKNKKQQQKPTQTLFDLETNHVEKSEDSIKRNDVTEICKTIYPQSTLAEERQEFFIPISGFIWLYPEEIEIVNHPMFQRLGNIYQLGQTYLVYRGATHKRIEHVLGTLHMVHRIIASIKYTYKKSLVRKESVGAPITDSEERFIRLGALLHDIGHVAAGHTLEDELCIISKHDSDERLNLIFENKEDRWVDRHGRSLKEVVDNEFATYLPKDFPRNNISPSLMVRLLIRKGPKKTDMFQKEQKFLEKSDNIRLATCRDIIGNTICADLLDYLYRDWYHLGKQKIFDERILQYMKIKNCSNEIQLDQVPKPKASDRFVISLGKYPQIRTDAVSAILDLLESCYHLAESVLFHRTKIAASAMLDRALLELWEGDSSEIENFILPLSDEQLITECRKRAEEKNKKVAAKLLAAIEKRQLFKTVLTFGYGDPLASKQIRENVQKLYFKNPEVPKEAALNRAKVLRNLEKDFKLPEGCLAMYCPSAKMNAKIAEVRISVGDDFEELAKYEHEHGNPFSGGHLDAQIQRFHRLWKVHFFVDINVYKYMENILNDFREAIYKLVLGCLRHNEKHEDACLRIVRNLKYVKDSPWLNYSVEENNDGRKVAYKAPDQATLQYPTGAPCLKNFFIKNE